MLPPGKITTMLNPAQSSLTRQILNDKGLLDKLRVAIDEKFFNSVAGTVGGRITVGDDLVRQYVTTSSLRILDPNPFFEEAFYRRTNEDVANSIKDGKILSGLIHFLQFGAEEGRRPNSLVTNQPAHSGNRLDPSNETYFKGFQMHFPHLSLEFLTRKFRILSGKSARTKLPFADTVKTLFDPDHYAEQYPQAANMSHDEKLAHYLQTGAKLGYSPVRNFDERFYLAFHSDVREAVQNGAFKSGFDHYVSIGQQEGRLPMHDLKDAIELRHKGLTEPVGVKRVEDLERKIARPNIVPRPDNDRIVHIVVPDLNPDIEFAGYRSLIEIVLEMRRRGKRLNFIKTFSSSHGIDYFLYHYRDRKEVIELLGDVSASPVSAQLDIGINDRVLAYSTWDGYVAKDIVAVTNQQRHSFLIQEYEPVFYDFNSFRFLSDQAYRFPHFAIFNSELLKRYFQQNQIGVFHDGATGAGNHHFFEHHFTPPAQLNVADRPQKTFFLYARPEAHAGRNLFEISIMALRRYLTANPLKDDWKFVGLGAFSEYNEVHLTNDHIIKIRNRLPFEEYSNFIETVDVGMSLMYAPHPSVLPFELLARGAVVVTNKFENRGKEQLAHFGDNLIVTDTTMDSLVSGLGTAFEKAIDYDSRIANAYVPSEGDWPTIAAGIVDVLEKEDLA
jgi:hypothetical protein